MFRTKVKIRKSFRKGLESGHVRKDGGMHEDEFETLGDVRGELVYAGKDELVRRLDVSDRPGCSSNLRFGELTGDSSSFWLCGRPCFVSRREAWGG